MKLKLNHSEFTTLLNLMQQITIGTLPAGLQAIVLHGVLFRLYKKFYNKAIVKRTRYSISLENDEAAAFALFFNRQEMAQYDNYTVALVHKAITLINQKFSV